MEKDSKGSIKLNNKPTNNPRGKHTKSLGRSRDASMCSVPEGGEMSNLSPVNCRPSRHKEVQNMPEKASSDEQSSPLNCEDLGALKIVNRELVHLVKDRNLRIMDLERKVKHLEACMREKKVQSAAEVLGEYLNVEVISDEDPEVTTTYLQDSSESVSTENETETPDEEDGEKLRTTSVVVTAAVRKEGLEDGETVRYDVLRSVVVGTNPVVSQEIKSFLREALEDIRGLVIELEETRRRDENEVTEDDDSKENEDPRLSKSLEEFNVAVGMQEEEDPQQGLEQQPDHEKGQK